MKKIKGLIIVILISSLLSGCSRFDNTSMNTDVKPGKRIGVVLKALDSEHWLAIKKGAEKAAREKNIDLAVLAPEKEVDVEQQFRIIEDLIRQNVDALAIAPCDSERILPIIEKASESEIPVLAVDTNISSGIVSFIGTDNKMGGKMAGQRTIDILDGNGKVALITGVLGQQSHKDRLAGFKDALRIAPGIKIVDEQVANSEYTAAMTAMENILKLNPEVDVVFCTNAIMALGAMEVIDSRGKSGQVKIIGFDTQTDALNNVKTGKFDSVIAQNPYYMGYTAVLKAADYLDKNEIQTFVDTGTELITKENVDKYINSNNENISSK